MGASLSVQREGRYSKLSTGGYLAATGVATALWALVAKTLPAAVFRRNPLFKFLTPKDQREAERWVVSILHAFIASGCSLAALGKSAWDSYHTTGVSESKAGDGGDDSDGECSDEGASRTYMLEMMTISVGYFIADLWGGRFRLVEDQSNTIHHFAGIALIVSLWRYLPLSKEHLVAPFLVSELSTIPLGLTWLLKAFMLHDTPLYRKLLASFVALFFICRIAVFSGMLYHIHTRERAVVKRLGKGGRGGLYLACTLQWFWFYKIATKLVPRITKAA